jgi:hypothetical protein
VGLGPHARGWTTGCGEAKGAHYRGVVACSLCGGSPSSPLVATKMKGAHYREAVARAFFALEGQHASCMTCGPGPPCHGMDTPVCIEGGFSRRFEAGAGESAFKEGFIPRVAAMPCFSPTRGVLSPPSSLCPFAFKVSALRCRSLPWPCDFIPSAPRLSECSTWYTACLDGMCRRSAEGFAPASSTPVNLPLESSCLLSSLAGRCYRSCLSSAGGARPCGSGALPPVLGFKDVHQPRGGGE